MESITIEEDESNKKPINIVLLGDESSEKEKLMSKFLLLNSPQFQENEVKNEEDKEEDISIFQNIIHCVELHGEKLKMKLWDNPSTDEFLSPSIKIAQGILLFYSVKDRKSFEKIQNDLSKIIELGRFDIPIIVIGNHKTSPEREVTYEEAKAWADNYGLRFYETSLEKDGSIKQILQDIGEQLLFQECIFSANNSMIINDNDNDKDELLNLEENLNIGSLIESKNKEIEKKEKKEKSKEMRNSLSYIDKENILGKNYSSNNLFDKENNNLTTKNKDNKINKQTTKKSLYKTNSSNYFQKIKPKLKTDKSTKEEKHLIKNNSTIINTDTDKNSNTNKISKFLNYSKFNIINKTKNLFKKNNSINQNKTSYFFHSKHNSVNSINLSSPPDNHSYLKKTTLTKNREKEVKEKIIKIEKESQTISAKREREGLEQRKKKNLEIKENYLKKIKEDKILQKEKEKKKKEEEIKIAKNNYDKLKQEKELITQEKKIEKEKDILNKLALKQSEKEKINKRVEEMNKEREKKIENMKNKKLKDKEKLKEEENDEKIKSSIIKIKPKKIQDKKLNISPVKHRKESSSFNLSFNAKLKSENINIIDKTRKDNNKLKKGKETNKEKDLNEKILSIKIESEKEKETNDLIKAKEEYKNYFINNQNNEDIYRCLKCNSIPKIFFNENNQEIETFCDSFHINNSNHNITSYQNFQTKSLDHSLYENTFCYFCNKSLSKLESNDMIFFCPLCKFWFCSKDENIHLKQKHQNEIDIKNKYKSIMENKIKKRGGTIELDLNKKCNSNIINSTKRLSLKINSSSVKQDLKKIEDEERTQGLKNIPQKEIIKIPIYLLDTFCHFHDEKYKSYCHSCKKNICNKCITKEHKGHFIENFEDIMPNEEEINRKKLELRIIKENLSKINEYFMALIEAIKIRFERNYKAKQKELEIKEKIIKDYEKIKNNYNCILNVKNLNLSNKQNFINATNNINWLESLNLIFEYLNSSLVSEKENIFRDLSDNNKYNMKNIYFDKEEIKTIIKLNDNDIALFNNINELKIINLDTFNEKMKSNIFNKGEEINHIIKLRNGDIACCGYEHVKRINFDLFNQNIFVNNIINEKYNNYLSVSELYNNYLVTSDISKYIKLWKKTKCNKYECLNILKDTEIHLLYNIDTFTFIGYGKNDKKLKKYTVLKSMKLVKLSELNNISIIKGNNSVIKYEHDYIFINYEENNKFGIAIIKLDKFEIISKITNVIPISYVNNFYEKEKIITINENCFIQKLKFSKTENKFYECDKIRIFKHSLKEGILEAFIKINDDIILLQYKNKVSLFSKNTKLT